jgi:Fe2+ transport system protein FeoA
MTERTMDNSTRKKETRLSDVPLGMQCIIRDIHSHPETCQRLREIGFNKHTNIRTLVLNSSQFICEVNNTRIGMHRRIANEIIIDFAATPLLDKNE